MTQSMMWYENDVSLPLEVSNLVVSWYTKTEIMMRLRPENELVTQCALLDSRLKN